MTDIEQSHVSPETRVDAAGADAADTQGEGGVDAVHSSVRTESTVVSRGTLNDSSGSQVIAAGATSRIIEPAIAPAEVSRETAHRSNVSEPTSRIGALSEVESPMEPSEVSRETTSVIPGASTSVDAAPAFVMVGTTALDRPAAPSPADVSRETEHDTPIAREAANAVRVLNVRQETWPRPPATRVMTVANQKGGVGKTTTAVNIAAALALHGERVLLIDLDPQGNASTALGIDHGVGTPSIYDVLLGGQTVASVAAPTEISPTLWCAPATLDLAGADIELTSQVAREYRLQRALRAHLATADVELDYVIIDCPPSLGLLTLNALVAAQEMLIPIQCEYYALEGLAQLLNTVELVTSHLNPDLAVSTVLLTMYDSRTRLADQVADEVRRHFTELVLTPTIPRNVRVSEAPGYGQTVITYDPGSRGAVAYLQAAREIADRGAAPSDDAPTTTPEDLA